MDKPAEGKATLADDKVLGKVVDVQGITAIRPPLYERWTPACVNLPLKAGDWLRTDVRGANALQVRLANKTSLILGPGSLVELVGAGEIRASSGEFEIQAAEDQKLVIHGPGKDKQEVTGAKVFRVQNERLVAIAKEPKWLRGFKGSIVNETLGSLVAKVDGRNVPLTVGDHKVRVDIRDQIARTTIEESFVNHTDATLEGVFYFPLPADASISGFGMWIGDQLVEADVVEKQRAREIYETILREKRDPGLLEWSGGNLFKARVFPILPNSDKRIKITYTQVLPLRGSSFRYSYALQSEMLKQNPLRELAIDVHVYSTLPLVDVSSPTHSVRKTQAKNSANVQFSAQEYTPERDFEVVIDVQRKGQEVVFVPHQRGSDGYFMLLINPLGGAWERTVIANSEPLDVIILADTSGSMDRALREAQDQFVAALLGSLGPKDTFRLAACDVDCQWMSQEAHPASEKNVAAAREFLAARRSLGWTDLDAAFKAVMERAGPKTQVVYIGDGIVTTGDAEPADFASRLKQMYAGKGTFHAVAAGSTHERVVLQTIASLGGGSVRRISAGAGASVADSAPAVARDLLSEIAQPAIRDLAIEFHGLRTARVYPDRLPNLPAGSQQIVLGRYLPDAASAEGEIIVSGTQNGKPVRFRTAVSLDEAALQARRASKQSIADEHSFVPRLWARMHLDSLLEQGQTQVIQDDIIALSEEYQIMTPYTSFLVLESDADRERFKVKRRFQMRDGEKFFAQGRDNANYELAQQQMKRAGLWRMNLQRRILAQLATLGRNPAIFRPQAHSRYPGLAGRPRGGMAGGFGGGGGELWGYEVNGDLSPMSGMSATDSLDEFSRFEPAEESFLKEKDGLAKVAEEAKVTDTDLKSDDVAEPVAAEPARALDAAAETPGLDVAADKKLGAFYEEEEALGRLSVFGASDRRKSLLHDAEAKAEDFFAGDGLNAPMAGGLPLGYAGRSGEWYGYQRAPGYYWFQSLVPTVPAAPAVEKPIPASQAWPAEARAIAESLLRRDKLAKAPGVEINLETRGFDARRGTLGYRTFQRALISPKEWLTRDWSDSGQTSLNWANEKERGTISTSFGIGRTREASPTDLAAYGLDIGDFSLRSLERAYLGYTPELEKQGDDRVVIKLKTPGNKDYEVRLLIDTQRHVLLRVSSFYRGKLTSATSFSDFVQVAGTWWATRAETTDEKERATSTVKVSVKELGADAIRQEIEKELAGREQVVFFKQPLPGVRAAKQALADGKANINHRLILALYYAHSQQWERVKEHVAELVKLAGDRPGREWLEMATLMMTRRNEELRQQFLAKGRALAEVATADKSTNNEYFLAAHLLGQANQVLQGNELLAVADSLMPIYDKLPEHLLGDKLWKTQRVTYLQQVGQQDAAFELIKELATKYREDQGLQIQYVNFLTNRGEYEAAYARLEELLADARLELTTSEADSYRSQYVQFLENDGRVDALASYLEKWIAANPESSTPYQQYLSALQRSDQEKKVDELVEKWLADGRDAVAKDEQLPPAVSARLEAAVNYALGHVGPWWTYRIEEKWIEPLAQAVRVLARRKNQQYANTIMQHQSFRDTDQAKQLRKEFVDLLAAEAATLPAERIGQIVGWIAYNNPIVETETWKKIAAELVKRWAAEKEIGDRRQLGTALVQIYGGHIGQAELLAFLERQLKEGPAEDQPSHVTQLFDTLLSQPWKQEHEDRAYALLKEIGEPAKSEMREDLDAEAKEAQWFATVVAKLDALHRLNDRMVTARYAAAMAAVEHQEKLTRTELATKRKEALSEARAGVADRLKREREEYGKEIAPWMTIERSYLEVRLARDIGAAIGEAWEFVGAKPKEVDVEQPFERLAQVLQSRHLTTLAYLATRKGAAADIVQRLLNYYTQGIEGSPAVDDMQKYWRTQKFRLLVAMDRPQELEALLKGWIDPKIADNSWKVAMGYLLAEQARFDDAIKMFEEVEKADELGAVEYRALADWYQVQNDREKHERASLLAYMALGERWLSGRLNVLTNPWYRGDANLPRELDPEVLKVFTAIFRKSEHPQNYVYHLQRMYQATRDFRLVATLADGVLGHSALKIYPILESMRSLLSEVRDEATVDQLAKHVHTIRPQAQTDVDRRALDLLEAVIERRAAELQNQPDPHARAAVVALSRASKGQWADGERRLLADLLSNWGRVAAKPLAEEQLRRLEELYGGVGRGSYDRLYIGHRLANTKWAYEKWDDAIRLIEAALAEFRTASGGVLPQSANDSLAAYVNFLMSRGQYARGEQVYLAEIKTAPNMQQRHWLVQQLYALYTGAVSADGRVSLGKGQTLYKAAETKMLADLDTPDHNHRYQLALQLCSLYRAAHQKKLDGVADDVRALAFKRLPDVLKRQTNNYQYVVSNVAYTMHDVAGARDGLAFLIERLENEPRWLRYQNQDGWSQHSYYLGQWRLEVKELGDLAPRLLKVVTDELRRDLQSRQSRNRNIYVKHTQYFWAEKEDAFALVAEEVLEKNMKSSAAIAYIAEYFWSGLTRRNRAIEILLAAHERKVLDENAIGQLVNYLHEVQRFAESIAILSPLVERRPENMTYRVQLMHAYFRTGQRNKLLALLKATDDYFHEKKQWNEGNIAALGQSTLANQLFDQSVAYFKEAIALREQATSGRSVGDDMLSTYYMGLAQAHAGLKQTPEAVEAAGGAIVAWGPRHPRRAEALNTLKNVLAGSPDLDALVAKLDGQVAETGLENAIVRKSVGFVYLDRGDVKKAIAQLQKAAEVQPNDAETHKMLVAAYDKAGDKQGAIAQLFASLQLSRREIQLYKDLAQRYAAAGDAKQAERAYLSIVEALPNESESHAMLAEVREQQTRWNDAAEHWRHVAEIRKLEPTGLLKLASAQLQLKDWEAAGQTIRQLEKHDWPGRFSDVQQKTRELAQKLNAKRS